MQEKKIIIFSAFNNHAISDIRFNKEWIDTRMNIFMNYTLRSFKAQSNQEFTAYITYEKTTEDLVKDSISRYEKLPNNVKFISSNLFNTNVRKCIKDFEYVYLVRIDCDDMYHKSYIQQLVDFQPKPETKVIINQKGIIYDSLRKRMANHFSESPPFYTLIYKSEDYINGLRHSMPKGHPSAIKLPHEIIDKKNFIYHIHSANTADRFNHRINVGGLTTSVKVINIILEDYIGKVE